MASPKPSYLIPSIERAFRVLERVSRTSSGMTVTEISNALDLPVSSASAILNTLRDLGYLVRDKSNFRLSMRLAELSNRMTHGGDLRSAMSQPLKMLVERVDITAHGGVLEDGNVVYIEKIEPKGLIRINTHVGLRTYVHCTALGKVLLAYMEPEQAEQILSQASLPKLTRNTITDKETLLRLLAEVREQGWAFDAEEEEVGMSCLAVPIFEADGKVRSAISLSGAMHQFPVASFAGLLQAAKAASSEVSRALGYPVD